MVRHAWALFLAAAGRCSVAAALPEECQFASDDHYLFCCCDRKNACWPLTVEGMRVWEQCCAQLGEHCPRGSPVFREVTAQYVGRQQGEATYLLGPVRTTARQIFDCDHDAEWAAFRRMLDRYAGADWAARAALDDDLVARAERLVGRFNISAHPAGPAQRALQIFIELWTVTDFIMSGGPIPAAGDIFCFFGFVAASFVLAARVQDRTLLRDAQSFFAHSPGFDISSSTSWPVGYWDLALNLGAGRPPRVTTLAGYLADDGRLPTPRGSSPAYPGPCGDALVDRGRQARMVQVEATAFVEHPALDVEIPSFLLRVFPDHVRIRFAFSPASSSYRAGSTLLEHVCGEFRELCAPPHVAAVADSSTPWQPADIILCSWYTHCAFLQNWAGSMLPLVSYYGGVPLNSYTVRAGIATVARELKPMHEYLERNCASSDGSAPPALLLVDAPYTAEVLHAYTGVRLPVYRPLSCYARATYTPAQDDTVLVPQPRSTTTLAKSGVMINLLNLFAGPEFRPKFHVQDTFLSFREISTFRAIVYWPGPHSWVLMQFREMYNLNMPLLVPRRQELLLHSADWHEKLQGALWSLPVEAWLPQRKHWEVVHPVSPWPPQDRSGAAYAKANMYWVEWLEFYQWPHVQVFNGLPHLLQLVRALDGWDISHKMARTNRAAYKRATEFWRDALPGFGLVGRHGD